MHLVRVHALAIVIGGVIAIGAITPAHADETPQTVSVAPAAASADVVGESWSAPGYPVDCSGASAQISCSPANPADVVAQVCYLGVLVDGASATVCTTYEGHRSAIQTAGGKPALVAYGCSVGDVACVTFENAGRGMAIGATAMMYAVAANMRFDTGSLLWDAAIGEWSFWSWAILAVTLAAMIWAVAAAVISGERGELIAAIIRSFAAVAAVPLTLWMTGHLLNAVDEMTWYIMNRDGPVALFSTLQSVMWAGGQANYFFAFVIHGLLMLGMLLLMLVFTFRNIVLAALIAVGPVAWMIFPVRGVGPQWVVRYVSAVVVLLLTGPLTIGFITLIINGLSTVTTVWDPQAWPLLVGLALVAFAPFAIFGLFSFVGAVAADGIGSRLGSHAGSMGTRAARTAVAIPSRLGAAPAGIARGGGARVAGSAANSGRPGSATRGPASRGGATPPRRPSDASTSSKTVTPPTASPVPATPPTAVIGERSSS